MNSMAGMRWGRKEPRSIPVEEMLDGRHYRLRAELPGLEPAADLRVTCTGSEIRLDAMRRPRPGWPTGRSEFRYGRRLRAVHLPASVQTHTLAARYVNGLLEVTAALGDIDPCPHPFVVSVDVVTGGRSRRRARPRQVGAA